MKTLMFLNHIWWVKIILSTGQEEYLQGSHFCKLVKIRKLLMVCVHSLYYLMVDGDNDECIHERVILNCNISWPAGVTTLPSPYLGLVISIRSLSLNYTSLLKLNLAPFTYPAMCQHDHLEQSWVSVFVRTSR